ncbi:hypothetical protein SDC9_55026 [bioreactor metagenome]|uniref:Uncharacterized protein n=1 Tax=bioreactor metagenome TaxID=1076179 RepID=A0A644WY18_9ZZZZ
MQGGFIGIKHIQAILQHVILAIRIEFHSDSCINKWFVFAVELDHLFAIVKTNADVVSLLVELIVVCIGIVFYRQPFRKLLIVYILSVSLHSEHGSNYSKNNNNDYN